MRNLYWIFCMILVTIQLVPVYCSLAWNLFKFCMTLL